MTDLQVAQCFIQYAGKRMLIVTERVALAHFYHLAEMGLDRASATPDVLYAALDTSYDLLDRIDAAVVSNRFHLGDWEMAASAAVEVVRSLLDDFRTESP